MTRKKWTIIVLLFLLLIPSAVLAQEDLPPVDIANTLDSGMLAVVVLIVMLVERLLGKILPYITKSNGNKGDDATKTIKILCDQLRNIDTVNKDTNVMVKEFAWMAQCSGSQKRENDLVWSWHCQSAGNNASYQPQY